MMPVAAAMLFGYAMATACVAVLIACVRKRIDWVSVALGITWPITMAYIVGSIVKDSFSGGDDEYYSYR